MITLPNLISQAKPRATSRRVHGPAPIPAPISAQPRRWSPLRRWVSKLADQRGGTLVESAITMTLLLMVILGILDCSRALYFDHYVRYSAEEATRYAMVRGSTWNNSHCATTAAASCTATQADVTNLVTSITPFGDTTNLSVNTIWNGLTPTGAQCSSTQVNNSPGCVVEVQVSYNFNFILPFLPKGTVMLGSTSAVAIAQ